MRNIYHVNHIIHQLALHFIILRHVDIPQCADMPHSPLQCLQGCLLYRPIKCRADQEKLQRDLSALQDWADRWGMCFNPSKCSVLRVSRPKSKNLEFQYTLKGETLENVSSTPYLGVCLSKTLEWEAHINKITSKANSTLGFLRRNLKACPPKLRETAYFSLVRSSLEYSSAVWDPFRQKDIDKLKKNSKSSSKICHPKL